MDSLAYSIPNNLDLINLKLINKSYEIILNLIDSKYLTFSETLNLTYSNLNLLQQKIIEFHKKKSNSNYLDLEKEL